MAKNRFVTTTRRPGRQVKDGFSVIILCGNMGYRMKSYGPKSLLTFPDGTLVIERLLETVELHFPNSEIVVGTGFEADRVISRLPNGVHVVENQLYETTNDVEELRLCLNATTRENIIIINGDLIFNNVTLDKLTKKGSSVVVSNTNMSDAEIGVTIVDDKVTIFAYDLPTKWCNIVYVTGKELDLLRKVIKNRDRNKWFIFEALNMVIESGGSFTTSQPKHMDITKIDKLKDWKALQ